MKLPIRLTLVIALAIAASSLFVGALFPVHGSRAANSPYLSQLSDMSVPTAEAVPCNTICQKNGPDWTCVACDLCGLACHISGHHCDNLSGLCP